MRRLAIWLALALLLLVQAVATTSWLVASGSGRSQGIAVAARFVTTSHPGDIWAPK